LGTIKILTRQYRNYDLYNGYKGDKRLSGRAPYKYYKKHKAKYYKGYTKEKPQKSIGRRNSSHSNKVVKW
jgi:hypothetical protein